MSKGVKAISVMMVFFCLGSLVSNVNAYGPTHPSVNTVVAGGPYRCSEITCSELTGCYPDKGWSNYVPGTCSGSDVDAEGYSISFMNWMNEHIDYQYWGRTMLARYYTRNQPLGEYYVIQSDIFGSPRYNDLINYFQSRGFNPEDAFTHWNKNTVQTAGSPPISYLMPGWDPLNDPGGDYTRNWSSDYSKTNNDFTINYSSNSITHSGKNWTANQWAGDIVRLGWGSFDDTKIDFTVASNTSNTIYVSGTIPNRTYLYYFVDDKDAPNHNAVAKIKFDSRMYAHGWSSGSPSADFSGIRFDISNENVRNWTAGYLSNLLKAQREGPNAYNGPLSVQEDDIKLGLGGDNQFMTDISWTEIQNRILEPGMKNSPNLNFTNSLKLTYQKTRQSMTANVSGISYLCGNIGGRVGTYPDRMDPIIEEMDCIFNEGFVSTQWGAFATLKTGLEKYQSWGKISFIHASTGLDRIYSLAAYYIVKDANTYYMYDTNPDYGVRLGNPDNWWYGLMEVDIGMPSGPANTIAVGSSQAWQRDFTKGKVFLKPTGNGSTMTINLGGSYYRLDVSGNPIGGAITSLTLNENEGAVLVPTSDVNDEKNPIPLSFELPQNYPNPFNPTTQINYQIPEDEYVSLEIYNVLGQKVKTLVNQNQTAGKHTIIWEGKDNQNQELPSGIYFYRLKTKQNVETRKMVFLK